MTPILKIYRNKKILLLQTILLSLLACSEFGTQSNYVIPDAQTICSDRFVEAGGFPFPELEKLTFEDFPFIEKTINSEHTTYGKYYKCNANKYVTIQSKIHQKRCKGEGGWKVFDHRIRCEKRSITREFMENYINTPDKSKALCKILIDKNYTLRKKGCTCKSHKFRYSVKEKADKFYENRGPGLFETIIDDSEIWTDIKLDAEIECEL